MEFVQFHPTALAIDGAPRFLVSEAVRGEGALLRNGEGQRFVEELAPRDQVARAIYREQRAGRGPVRLDVRHLDPERVRTRFPRIVATCLRHGLDLTREPVPVTPAAHYVMGGVATDLRGATTLPGLFAAGEAAGNGVHGANRLASNSLLEGLVYGARAADAMADAVDPRPTGVVVPERPGDTAATPAPGVDRESLRREAWSTLGLERDGASLRGLLAFLAPLRSAARRPVTRSAAETRNLADVAWAMAACALYREESRGGHYRRDFTESDDRYLGHTLLEAGTPRLVDVDAPIPERARA
jgi:L-aspartate oxidase